MWRAQKYKISTFNSAKLKDPATGQWVDNGVDIPLEQILAGPKRGQLQFEPSDGDRSVGQMVAGNADGLPEKVSATGWKPGKRKARRVSPKGK